MGKSYRGCSRKPTKQLNVLPTLPLLPVAVSIWYGPQDRADWHSYRWRLGDLMEG